MMDEMKYDPERNLWIPGRRKFFFMLGSAAIGSMLPGQGLDELTWPAPTGQIFEVVETWAWELTGPKPPVAYLWSRVLVERKDDG